MLFAKPAAVATAAPPPFREDVKSYHIARHITSALSMTTEREREREGEGNKM